MKKLLGCFLCVMLLVFGASTAGAVTLDLTDLEGPDPFGTLGNQLFPDGKGDYGYINGAFFQVAPTKIIDPSSGTGVMEPYLSIHKKGFEHAFNTDAKKEPFDAKRGANPNKTDGWTHSITVGDLNPVGNGFFEFLLDINEPNNQNSKIELTGLEVYIVSKGSSTYGSGFATEDDYTGSLLGGPLYDIGDNSVLMDYTFWKGSGQNIDTIIHIPIDTSNWNNEDYVYTYWAFGDSGNEGETSEAGFEEISIRSQAVPEPATMFLLGSGLVVLAGFGRRKFKS